VKAPTQDLAARYDAPPVRFQGNWFPHRLRPATEDGVFFAGDAAGHCLPLSGEGIRTALFFGDAAGREMRAVLAGEKDKDVALADYARISSRRAAAFALLLAAQKTLPRLPPRLLTRLIRLFSRRRLTDAVFSRYLALAPAPSLGASASASASTSARPSSGA
jgi:flavin-dependent dehydrogenase